MARDQTFPLTPRRRLVGLPFGAMHSARRGSGSDVAGTRPYQVGDDVRGIDWAASARLSSAHGSDEFIVREWYADEAPFVVVVNDRRPAMRLYPEGLPWLRKPAAVRACTELIGASAIAARGFVGYLDFALGEDDPFWRPPQSPSEVWHITERHLGFPEFRAQPDTVARSLEFLARHRRSVPSGSFVFVLSDFLERTPHDLWARALEQRWDVVPVVIQDPTWEQGFPDVSGIVVSLRDPATGRVTPVRLRRKEALRRRDENEARVEEIMETFRYLDVDPVLVSTDDRADILAAFLAWSDLRRTRRVVGA
jgi:uncharacterized protein (DUF58 family)